MCQSVGEPDIRQLSGSGIFKQMGETVSYPLYKTDQRVDGDCKTLAWDERYFSPPKAGQGCWPGS